MIFLFVFIFMAIGGPIVAGEQCNAEDYSPCTCQDIFGSFWYVNCYGVSVEDIKNKVFKRTTERDLSEVTLNLIFNEDDPAEIPADILGDKRVSSIELICDDKSSKIIKVHEHAWRSTSEHTEKFLISNCEFDNLGFLAGFDRMWRLKIVAPENTQSSLKTLPALRSLSYLQIGNSPEINDLNDFPQLVKGLTSIELTYSPRLNDEGVSRILKSLSNSSVETLRTFEIESRNALTRIPPELTLFQTLTSIRISDQNISTITSGSISSSKLHPFHDVKIVNSGVETIEPGAFQGGSYKYTEIDLTGNLLSRLDSRVFQAILKQMVSSSGKIILDENPIDCVSDPGHLSWLIRDNRELLKPIREGRCSDGRSLTELSPSSFSQAPVTVTDDDCIAKNYEPCSCNEWDGYGRIVDCQGVTVDDLKDKVFKNKTKTLQELELNLYFPHPTSEIPANILGENLVTSIKLSCQSSRRDPLLQVINVDMDAFRSTSKNTTSFEINGCEIRNLRFLTDFEELTNLKIVMTENMQLSLKTLPNLRSLTDLEIWNSPELHDFIHVPQLVNGLNSIKLFYNSRINDEGVSRILESLAESSAETLESFTILGSALTKVPPELSSFQKLTSIVLSNQNISTISSDSISSSNLLYYVRFVESGVRTIEPGAFQGAIYEYTDIDLTGNLLTRLESEVFQGILEQMVTNVGTIILYGNPIDCNSDPCHLTWLIDNPKMLKRIVQGRCSNGTLLTELSPSGFNHCPNPPTSSEESTSSVDETSQPRVFIAGPIVYPSCRSFSRSLSCRGIADTEVRDAFKRLSNNGDLHDLVLYLPARRDLHVTADLIDAIVEDKRYFQIKLECDSTREKNKVDPDAFRSFRKDTAVFHIRLCDLAEFDFAFLADFDQLVTLHITRSINIQNSFSTLPPLKSLTTLVLQSTTGIETLTRFPTLVNGLKFFRISDVWNLRNKNTILILKWLNQSSADTLKTLAINTQTSLTRVPQEISSFTQLDNLHLEEDNLPVLTSGSISFSGPVENVYLMGSKIKIIEPNAFQGDFSNATVHLYNNELTRFDESVFRPMLEQMTKEGSTGSLIVHGNPFDCETDPCHLAWLVHRNQELLKPVKGGFCSNGLKFEPSFDFSKCQAEKVR